MTKVVPSSIRKTDKVWRDAILRALKRRDSKEDPQALEKLADALVLKGIGGDVPALREIGDRLDGKPAQVIQGDPDAPIGLSVSWATSRK